MAKQSKPISPGDVFGRWTVVSAAPGSETGRRWLCRCSCGTEREVAERSLRSGTSQSCGCLRRERTEEALTHDLTGRTFGELKVLHRSAEAHSYGGTWWVCRCRCGELCHVPGTLLMTGRRTCCNGDVHRKYDATADITGRRFGRLVALKALTKRDLRYSVIWLCRCDCGQEVEIPYNTLVYGKVQSCGCKKREKDAALPAHLTRVAGTSVDRIKSKRLPENNDTGAKGVYWVKGRWTARLVFQKKTYHLGSFDKYEDALKARRAAEELVFAGTVAHYEKWKAKADADPAWGEANPIEIRVERKEGGTLAVTFLPMIPEEGNSDA